MPTNIYGIFAELMASEVFWRDHYEFILHRGYRLRGRYKPDWVPSWKTQADGSKAEDRILGPVRAPVTNAWRCTDDAAVVLKRVERDELKVLQYLHSLPASPRNRTVPLLEVLSLEDSKEVLIVMPLFGSIHDDPPYQRLPELLHALHEIMTGINFMHEHEIAHRDACLYNFVMDKSELVPSGFNFMEAWRTPDVQKRITTRSRSAVKVAYFIIDFDVSMINPPACGAWGNVGQDNTVPELRDRAASYDPYKLDIYQVGNMIRNTFIANYDGVDCLTPLAEAMTREVPAERPSAAEVVNTLQLLKDSNPDGPSSWIHLKTATSWERKEVVLRDKLRRLCARFHRSA